MVNCKEGMQSRRKLVKENRRPSLCGLRHQQNVDIFGLNKIPSTLSLSEGFLMGKTLPPYSQLIEAERRRWAPFKRALPKEDQGIFDRLFDCAKLHIQAGVMVSRPWPFETIVMAILLEQEKRIARLVHQLDDMMGSRPGTEHLAREGGLTDKELDTTI
jgi:hypothetical protein